MVALIVEPLDPEVMQWLVARHPVRYAPELARDARAFRAALPAVRGLLIPATVALDAETLAMAPHLRVVGRLSAGIENIDFEACARAGVEIARPLNATAQAECEYLIGALLQMLRRVPVVNAEGLLVGRELSGSTVGLIGMGVVAEPLAKLLMAFGTRVIGYDPGLHTHDPRWSEFQVEPAPLRDLMELSDCVCVTLSYFSRYHQLLGERYLPSCRPNQVLASISPSGLFDAKALAEVLGSGRMAAAWFDSMEPGMLDGDQPLANLDNLQVTPRVASTTRESRIRAAWDVAQRLDELMGPSARTPKSASA